MSSENSRKRVPYPSSSPFSALARLFNIRICHRHQYSKINHSHNEDVMAAPRVQLTDDSQLPGSSTNPTPATPRRTTVATFPGGAGYISRYMKANNGQCTHLTMTRLYTTDYRCCICLQVGSMGWVYRCTQDRELLLENDMERGDEVSHTQR